MQTKLWTDSYLFKLSQQEKYLFIYYLTNSHVNIIHLYECPDIITSTETGLDFLVIGNAKKKFQETGKIFFYKDYIFLKNASKYERYTGDTNEKASKKLFNELSKDVLDWYNKLSDTPINTSLIPSITHKLENNTNKSKQSYQKMDETINPDDIPL